jgi:hypothetical protein
MVTSGVLVAPGLKGTGAISIDHLPAGNESYNTKHGGGIRIAGAGVVRITKAPLGRAVVSWAGRRGNIHFTSASGISGTLHLKDCTVTLTPPASLTAVQGGRCARNAGTG